uniref:Putative secreted protein ovary overexpressed n=1 Tax=Rhipicephalus microplus TaxID=6941 RepID=A0A6M2D9H2_RHIMP
MFCFFFFFFCGYSGCVPSPQIAGAWCAGVAGRAFPHEMMATASHFGPDYAARSAECFRTAPYILFFKDDSLSWEPLTGKFRSACLYICLFVRPNDTSDENRRIQHGMADGP